jgi:hypothetical protein
VAGDAVVLFCVVDDHVHVVLFCDEEARGRYVRALSLALAAAAAAPIGPGFVRAVDTRGHLAWLADTYILAQPAKHGLAVPLATWEGSCFADLVGARVLPGLRIRIGDALPRWRLRNAYRAVGLPELPLEPADDATVRAAGATALVAASAAAVGADPEARGRAEAEVLARRAAVVVGVAAGIANRELAWALQMTSIASARLRERPVDPAVLEAVRRRVSLDRIARPPLPLRGESVVPMA